MRVVRGLAWGIVCLVGVLMMPPAIHAVDGPPTVLYAYMYRESGQGLTDLVQIDTASDTITKVLSIEGYWDGGEIARTIEDSMMGSAETILPPEEWQAFQDDIAAMSDEDREAALTVMREPSVSTILLSVWEARPGNLLLHRRLKKCFDQGGVAWCYGATQLSLFDIQTAAERVIWTLPFHHARDPYGVACYRDEVFENYTAYDPINQVLIHPKRDLVAVIFDTFQRRGCPDALFLIDYSLEAVTVSEFAHLVSAAWSPDGTQLAYIEDCTVYRDIPASQHRICTNSYGIIDLASASIAFFQEFKTGSDSWIAWPSSDTLVFLQTDPYAVVWHNLVTGVETSRALPDNQSVFSVITLRDGNARALLGNGKSSVVQSDNLILDDTEDQWTVLDEGIVWPMRLNSANSDYALLGDIFLKSVTLIDAKLNRYPVDLSVYRDRYGAKEARLVTVGVERP